jgi:putative transposase
MRRPESTLEPRDRAEALAVFRSELISSLAIRELEHGDLAAGFAELAKHRYRPPGAHGPRSYSAITLERWYYAFKSGGLDALRPKTRSDKGRGRELTDEQRDLLLAIRQEHPHVSVPTILTTLIADGRLAEGAISESTVRRFYTEKGLDRVALRHGDRDKVRLRWQAERPGALWHTDVCHGRSLRIGDATVPVRIHALLDDASRYVIAIEVRAAEREVDLIALLVRAIRHHGLPEVLYLDNGATYRGQALSVVCGRLGVSLVHARPYDAPARGKMERFWRTLREQCLDLTGSVASLHDLNVRVLAWVDERYHTTPHGALMGKTPARVYEQEPRAVDELDEVRLRDALTVRARRRLRRDNTLSMDGQDWETALHFLAGQLVTVARSLALPDDPPWIEHEDKRYPLTLVDPVANGKQPRRSPQNLDAPHPARIDFDPTGALLDRALGRRRGAP